jgi:TonB family protein
VPGRSSPELTAPLRARDLLASFIAHGALVALLLASRGCVHAPKPLIDPDSVMQVQMVAAMPKSVGRPDRATRAPDPIVGSEVAEKTAPPDPVNPKQMKFETETAPKEKGVKVSPEEAARLRNEALRSLQREQLVRSLDAPLSDANRVQTDPNGVEGLDTVYGTGSAGPMDPEIARYITKVREIVIPNWSPLPSIIQANPKLVTAVEVSLADDGTVRKARVYKGSGNSSFDESCVRAFQRAGRLPLPPSQFRAPGNTLIRVYLLASDAR